MKSFYKAVFATYVVVLLWLVLFKFSYDFVAVLDHQMRSLNLDPFVVLSQGSLREALDNLIVFVPFGLFLGMFFERVGFWGKLAAISAFSFAVEVIQYVLAIGTTDITDVIMNTAGGALGLVAYKFGGKYVDKQNLDRWIVVIIAVLLAALLYLRFFVFKVRY